MRSARALSLAAAMLVAVTGCGATPRAQGAAAPRVVAPSTAAPSSPPSASPPGDARPRVASPHATYHGAPATGGSSLSSAMLARIPQFPAPPPAIPVKLPAGREAGWFSRIPTTQPVAFITIDDGQVKHPLALPLLQASKVPVTLFLEVDAIKDNPGYFTRLQAAGASIEAHTISHPELKGRSYGYQKHQICDGADKLGTMFGRRPELFRPPYGDKDHTTMRVLKDCRMKAAFHWKATANDGKVWYQGEHRIHPGDIILMHFRERFPDDFLAILKAIHKAGLTPARLEDYVS